ncbi:MAG: hypothetical protein C4297_07500 [Gemmataceae bacterium]
MTGAKRLGLTWAVVAVPVALWLAYGQDAPKAREQLMKLKLQHAQRVLEGVAQADYALIERNARELILLSQKAEWLVYRTREYTMYSDEFRRNAGDLVQAAQNKNIDGCALAYVQMTMSCVNCHKYVRETRMAARP